MNYTTKKDDVTTSNRQKTKTYYDRMKSASWRMGSILMQQARAAGNEAEISRASRQIDCSRWLEIGKDDNGNYRVIRTQACKSRLCPWCAQRRSRRAYWTHLAIAQRVAVLQPGTRWLLVTVTVRNIGLCDVATTIRQISRAWGKMMRTKQILTAWPGYIRAIELTHNPQTNQWHPHIHALIPVPPRYWHKDYISQSTLCYCWQQALGIDYTPVCDIRTVIDQGGVAEISKYATKPLVAPTSDLMQLDCQLLGHRLVAYGGICRRAKRDIMAPDPDTAIDGTEDDMLPPIPTTATEWWLWDDRLQQYLDALPQAPPLPHSY